MADSTENFLKTNKTISGGNPDVVSPKTIWDSVSKETKQLIATQEATAGGVHPYFLDPEFIQFYEANNALSYQTRIGLWEAKLSDEQLRAEAAMEAK